MSTVYERLSSGQRINRASDDAAGLAVATSLNAKTRVYSQAVRNVSDGVSALNIADQAVASLADIVTRQRELAEQAANGVYNTQQRQALDTEAQALAQEYNRIIQTTKFNKQKLIDGTSTGINLQAGFGLNGVLPANILAALSSPVLVDAGTNTTTLSTFGYDNSLMLQNGCAIGDMNNDGYLDVVAVNMAYSDISEEVSLRLRVWLGSASGTFSVGATANAVNVHMDFISASSLHLELVDTDSDNDLDIQLNASMDGESYGLPASYVKDELFKNNTVGTTFSLDTAYNGDGDGTTNDERIGVGAYNYYADFNADGFLDNLNIVAGITGTQVQIRNTANSFIDTLAQSGFSLTSQSSALSAMTSLKTLQDELSLARGRIGASLSRLSTASSVLRAGAENYATAANRIMSADIAAESGELVRNQILQNAATAVLAQANQQPAISLKLLGDS